VFADKIGHARNLTVAPNGVVYVNTWSDGALYISDDRRGRIWRVTFHGDRETAGIEPASVPHQQ
jgi:hypothetical protein